MSDTIRTSVPLNERQIARLREIGTSMGVSQSHFIAACIDVLSNAEVGDIITRYESIRRADRAAKTKARYEAKLTP